MKQKAKTELCSNCGKAAKVIRGDYEWKDVDLPVLLKNVEMIQCGQCGTVEVIIPRINKLMSLLALAVILKPDRLTGGELRFLRKYIGKTGADFSKLIKVDKATLSKWENDDDPIGEQSDRLIRTVILALGDGLEMELRKAVLQFPEISRDIRPAKIEMDPSKMSYKYAA